LFVLAPGKSGDDYSAFKQQIGQSDMFGTRNSGGQPRPKRSQSTGRKSNNRKSMDNAALIGQARPETHAARQ